MGFQGVILAYVAPEVVLPLASALAGVIGFALMVGWAPIRFAAKGVRSVARGVRSIGRRAEPRGTRPPQAH